MLKLSGFWIKIAALFLLRSLRATAVLSLMVLAAVSTLIFLSSLAVGVNDAMVRNSVSLYSGHVTGVSLPGSVTGDDLKVEGVADVLKRVPVSGVLSHGSLGETITLIGVDPEAELRSTAIPRKIVEGAYPRKGEREAFISKVIADELKALPGDSILFTPFAAAGAPPIELTLSGTYKTGIEQLDRGIFFCPLDAIPSAPHTWSAAVFLETGVEPERIISAYADRFGKEVEFKSWAELMEDLRQLIDLNHISMGIVMVLVFGVVSLGIACALVIFILKSIREYGIMKAMGVTDRETAFLIVLEVILMSLSASIAGIIAGALAVYVVGKTGIDLGGFTSHNRYFAVSGIVFPRLTSYSLLLPPLLAFLSGLAAAVWPTILVARRKAVDILRMI